MSGRILEAVRNPISGNILYVAAMKNNLKTFIAEGIK